MTKTNIPISSEKDKLSPQKEAGQLSVDIFHKENKIYVLAPIAGVKPTSIKISLTKDVLTISGKRNSKHKVKEDDYYTKECFWGNFSRSIVLPLGVDNKKISADFENNVLEIMIPKAKKEDVNKTQIIKIKSYT
ncbi:Hsp20/alpha crystallin family protein [Patescibacteria group bacterium]